MSGRPPHPSRLRLRLAGACLLLTACARMGPPAGGPDDTAAPKLLGTVPESLGVYPGWKQDVEFRFDEVVSEGSTPNQGLGTGDLEKLVLLSPSREVPVVRWKRDRITVHPREGWQRNRVYRVELLPGLTDLRRNRSDTSTVLTFSTGGELPADTLQGLAIDWVQGGPARGALVELVRLPDSLVYRTVTDSSGRFRIGPLPRSRWMVFSAMDQNRNLRREQRESYDSAAAAEGTSRVPVLWLIPRDTVGPRIVSITPNDSMSATVAFSQPLDPSQRIDSSAVRFMLQRDSSPVPFRSLLPKTQDDSLQKLAQARADSIRAAADTAQRDAAPVKPGGPGPRPPGRPVGEGLRPDAETDSIIATRPRLTDKMVLRVDRAFQFDTRYLLEVRGLRSAAGIAADSRAALAIPKPRAGAAPAAADSLAPPAPDSAGPPAKPQRP